MEDVQEKMIMALRMENARLRKLIVELTVEKARESGIIETLDEDIRTCPNCGREYAQTLVEQTPGFRDEEDDVCPYCGHVSRHSMEWVFYNSEYD